MCIYIYTIYTYIYMYTPLYGQIVFIPIIMEHESSEEMEDEIELGFTGGAGIFRSLREVFRVRV